MERLVEMCSLETVPLQNPNGNDEVVIIADTTHPEEGPKDKLFPCCAREISISSGTVL